MVETAEFGRNYRIFILVSFVASRAIYALNWYDLSPGLVQLASDFHVSLPSLGILEAAFLAGAGIFQIPSSFAAARWNPRTLVVGGMISMGVANILFGLSPSFSLLVLLRFALGVGASMFFSPGLAIVAPLFKGNRQGLAIGIYNGAFNVGGVLALFVWNYITVAYGWRLALILGAVLSIAIGIENYVAIRHDTGVEKSAQSFAFATKALKGVLTNKQIWLIGGAFIGLWGALYSISQLVPYYEETVHFMSAAEASALTTIVFVLPIFIGPLGGHFSDRLGNRMSFLLYPGIAFGIATALIGFADLAGTVALMVIIGATDALVFMAMYAVPFETDKITSEQKAIAISLINCVQISGSFAVPIIFSAVASSYLGFQGAWIIVGIFVLLFIPLVIFARD